MQYHKSLNGRSQVPSYLTLFQETSINCNFFKGQEISFFSEQFQETLTGTVMKRYTNSCLVDISECENVSEQNRTLMNNRIIISYKAIYMGEEQ
ncbi:MAG: YkvS family protein [Lactobacillales bacterium]|jgi:hypothetical protein|nr:YkvS family protein [Lactobacillales bacterium]